MLCIKCLSYIKVKKMTIHIDSTSYKVNVTAVFLMTYILMYFTEFHENLTMLHICLIFIFLIQQFYVFLNHRDNGNVEYLNEFKA